jgi:hypothetical protein
MLATCLILLDEHNKNFLNYDILHSILLVISYGVELNRSWSDGTTTFIMLLVLNSSAR